MRLPRIERADNHRFTYEYAQPEDYRFCQDSVIFAREIATLLKAVEIDPATFRALDVCAGCGVIGFELGHHEPRLKHLDALEVQGAFRPYFERNREITAQADFHFIEGNYAELQHEEAAGRYDLIVANPPYFDRREGRLSPNEMQNRCRFFLDSDLATLVRGVANALKRGGSAYLLVKSGASHGRDLRLQLAAWLAGGPASSEVVLDIRGTWVVKIHNTSI